MKDNKNKKKLTVTTKEKPIVKTTNNKQTKNLKETSHREKNSISVSQNLTIKLPKELEKCLDYLETASKQSKEFIITEALIRYIEDMEDIQKYSILETLGELEEIKKQKTYTTEKLNKRLGI